MNELQIKNKMVDILKNRYGMENAEDLVNNKDFFTFNEVKLKNNEKPITIGWYYDTDQIEVAINMDGEEIDPDDIDE